MLLKLTAPLRAVVAAYRKIRGTKLSFGWKKDKEDPKDFKFWAFFHIPRKLPSKASVRDKCSPVFDQGNLGSCVMNALAGCAEYLDLLDPGFRRVSRLFGYFNMRRDQGDTEHDTGGTIRGGCKTFRTDGVCAEECWPYDIEKFTEKPPQACYDDAKQHRVTSDFLLTSLTEMKACIADGYPFALGFYIYRLDDETVKSGVFHMPTWVERYVKGPLGGHGVMAVGYDDDKRMFEIRNSWGEGFGDKGYGWLPYEYFTEQLATDCRTLRKMDGTLAMKIRENQSC